MNALSGKRNGSDARQFPQLQLAVNVGSQIERLRRSYVERYSGNGNGQFADRFAVAAQYEQTVAIATFAQKEATNNIRSCDRVAIKFLAGRHILTFISTLLGDAAAQSETNGHEALRH